MRKITLGTFGGPIKDDDGNPIGPIKAAKKYKKNGGKVRNMYVWTVPGKNEEQDEEED